MKYNVGDVIQNNKMSAEVIGFGDTKTYRGHPNTIFYKLRCLKCCGVFERDRYTAEKRDVGCPICANRMIVPGINDIPTTDEWMVQYFPGGYEEAKLYSSGSEKKIYPKCPVCGRIRPTPMGICELKRYGGFQCICHDGKTFPNKFIYGLAEELKRTNQISEFKNEYVLCGKLYDMCFIECNLLIEMDSGVNHGHIVQKHKKGFIPVSMFVNDMDKDKIASLNGFDIIRIDCFKSEFDYIKNNILNSDLARRFDMSLINWNHILELCTTNLVEKVCEYKVENPTMLASEIAPLFGISDVTARKYMKMGNDLGWCIYDPEIEWKNYLDKRTCYQSVPIYVDPDDEDYEPMFYESITEMQRRSKEDFGETISRSQISVDELKKDGVVSIDGYDVYLVKRR